jgi:hypothetical protein
LFAEICGIRITDKKESISDLKSMKQPQCNNISDVSLHQLTAETPATAAELEGCP